jgi:hypothetical protein
MKRTQLRRVSNKRAKQNKEYMKRRAEFLLSHPWCQVWLDDNKVEEWQVTCTGMVLDPQCVHFCSQVPRATEIHHKRGRTGERLNDETYWMAVSATGHNWIHKHPGEAYAKGWMVKR